MQLNEWAPPNIFIYGEEAVGKTLVIKTVLPSVLPSNSKVKKAMKYDYIYHRYYTMTIYTVYLLL